MSETTGPTTQRHMAQHLSAQLLGLTSGTPLPPLPFTQQAQLQ